MLTTWRERLPMSKQIDPDWLAFSRDSTCKHARAYPSLPIRRWPGALNPA